MLRQRESSKIRVDALRLGAIKAGEGCDGCADSYFALAQEHGATAPQIEGALEQQGSRADGYLTRRQVLKGIAVGAAGAAAMTAGLIPLEAAATSNYYGVDTNTTNCCSMPYTFYIGRFGYQLTQTTSGFNVTAAQQATSKFYVHTYWDLGGPNWPGANQDFFQWGRDQAAAAVTSWYQNPNAPYAYGRTIFADVEPGQGFENPTNQGNNQLVLNGWNDYITHYGGPNFYPGVYISPGNWNSYFGSGFRPTLNSTLWITGCRTCAISCAPANPNCGGTVGQVDAMWANPVSQTILGGNPVAIWQYWIGSCAYGGDWNVSSQSGQNIFLDYWSSTTYVCPGCGAGSPCP
jgi:hypothetical protein